MLFVRGGFKDEIEVELTDVGKWKVVHADIITMREKGLRHARISDDGARTT